MLFSIICVCFFLCYCGRLVYAHRRNKKKSAWIFTKAAIIVDQRFSCVHLSLSSALNSRPWRGQKTTKFWYWKKAFIIIHIEFSCLVFNFDVVFSLLLLHTQTWYSLFFVICEPSQSEAEGVRFPIKPS